LHNPEEKAEDNLENGWKELLEFGVDEKDTVIGIAAWGTTPYLVGALCEARKNDILTVSINKATLAY